MQSGRRREHAQYVTSLKIYFRPRLRAVASRILKSLIFIFGRKVPLNLGCVRLGSIRNKNNWNNGSKRLFGSYSHYGIPGFPFRIFCSQEQNNRNVFRNLFLFRNTLNERALNNFIISLYPTIKFTVVLSETSLNVLDLTLSLVDGYIQTDVYSKPTDHHMYLLRNSAHPRHCTNTIPFGVATGFAETVQPLKNMTNVVMYTSHISLREVIIHLKSVSNLKEQNLYPWPEETYLPRNRKTKKSSFLLESTITLIYLTSVKSSNHLVILCMNRHCYPRFSQRGQLFFAIEDPKT